MQKGEPIMAGLTGKRDGHYTARMNDELKANLLFLGPPILFQYHNVESRVEHREKMQ
jgi:hypothetical protein